MADTNKISIYLVKKHVKPRDLLNENYSNVNLGRRGTFYFEKSDANRPSWLERFFKESLGDLQLWSQSSKGILLTKVTINSERRTFAVPFGYGHSMIDKAHCESDFGLKIVLNMVDKIRRVERRTLSTDPKQTIEQLSKIGNMSDFGIDIEQDLLEEVTGKPKINFFSASLVTGKVAFTATVEVDVNNLEGYLSECYDYYRKTDYQDEFGFIDQIRPIEDSSEWNERLIEVLRNPRSSEAKVWMAEPEAIDWEEVDGFSYTNKRQSLKTELDLTDFMATLTAEQIKDMNFEFLKNRRIYFFKRDEDSKSGSWSAFKCLYCEISTQGKTVLLTNGQWYEIAGSFVQEVNASYNDTLNNSTEYNYIDCEAGDKEDDYNIKLTKAISGVLMDKKNIMFGGRYSRVELCDVYDLETNSFIHVKIGQSSSTLSHLFSQGRVSAELFLHESDFRRLAKEKDITLPFDQTTIPNARDYKTVFGIIEDYEEPLDIPFFSKVNFRDTKKLLRNMGLEQVFITKIRRLTA